MYVQALGAAKLRQVTYVDHHMKYVSYLLRLWSTEEEGEVRWRASLESPQGTRRLGFRSLEQLFAFLEDQAQAMEGKGRSFEKGPSDGQSV